MALLSQTSQLESGQTVYYGTAIPTSHDIFAPAKVGDIVVNTVPTNGSAAGWICTVAGTQAAPVGTWVSFYAGLTVPSVTNLLKGDGAGAILDAGVAATGVAPLASPTFTGHPVGVTEAPGNNSTRLATTAYVDLADEVVATFAMSANAGITTQSFFGRAVGAYAILAAYEIHGTAGTDGSAVTLDITADPAATAPGAGTSILTAAFDAKAAANTWQTGTLATATLAAGSRLSVKVTGTTTALANVLISVILRKA